MQPVINATGTLIHTNLGRSPLGEKLLEQLKKELSTYTTVEYSLAKQRRGHRSNHLKETLKELTGAESSAVVNNNAAAVFLVLKSLAEGGEVIVSRGELIEIGGSFRIPDIMESSGAKMVEVGSTNRTTIEDYEAAITENTSLIFKAHHSNFTLEGDVEEVSVEELVSLSKKHGIPFFYDLGSGLISKPLQLASVEEMTVSEALTLGVDILSFSTDKLFGGPQGGIIVGRDSLVGICERNPLMRVLRVGKESIASLQFLMHAYLQEGSIEEVSPLYRMLNSNPETIQKRAKLLKQQISRKIKGKVVQVVENKGQVGGGTLPSFLLKSYAVKIAPDFKNVRERETFAESLNHDLHALEVPIIPILKEGFIFLDCLTIFDEQVSMVSKAIIEILSKDA